MDKQAIGLLFGVTAYNPDMDDLDRLLVTELQRDARQTNRELAQRVGVASSTCFERVRRLHERGVIRGFHAEVDLAAIGPDSCRCLVTSRR